MATGDPKWQWSTDTTQWTTGGSIGGGPLQPVPFIEPAEGTLSLDDNGNLRVYRGKEWKPVTRIKLPEAPLAEIDLDALNTDLKTIKREVNKRVLWLEEKADNMEGDERIRMEDAIHYLRSAIEELDRIRGQE